MNYLNFMSRIIIITNIIVLYTFSSNAFANVIDGDWRPQIVEKMFIWPPKQLERVLNNDFKSSSLFLNLKNTDHKIQDRHKKIDDLNKSIPSFNGEEQIELKHQVILEKRDYIKDMNTRLNIKKKHLLTKKRFFEQVRRKAIFKNDIKSNDKISSFQKNKSMALKRAEKMDKKISDLIITNNLDEKSKYFNEYYKTKKAMNLLEKKIATHPMFKANDLLTNPQNKISSLDSFIQEIESELSVLELKEQMLTQMAKLVSLDAMDLAEVVSRNSFSESQSVYKDLNDPTNAIELFIN